MEASYGTVGEVATEIAIHLSALDGQQWTVKPSDNQNTISYLNGPEGMAFRLAAKPSHNVLSIMGVYPEDNMGVIWPLNQKQREIGVRISRKKTPEEIAREVHRRLLPRYKEVYAEGIEAARISDEKRHRVGLLLKELAQLAGGRGVDIWNGFSAVRLGSVLVGSVDDDSLVTLELRRLAAETAREVICCFVGESRNKLNVVTEDVLSIQEILTYFLRAAPSAMLERCRPAMNRLSTELNRINHA